MGLGVYFLGTGQGFNSITGQQLRIYQAHHDKAIPTDQVSLTWQALQAKLRYDANKIIIIIIATQVSMLNHMCYRFRCFATLKVAYTCVTTFVASQP